MNLKEIEPLARPPKATIVPMSLQPAIPSQVALQQSLRPLRRPQPASFLQLAAVNCSAAKRKLSPISLSQPRGPLQSVPPTSPPKQLRISRRVGEKLLEMNTGLKMTICARTQGLDTLWSRDRERPCAGLGVIRMGGMGKWVLCHRFPQSLFRNCFVSPRSLHIMVAVCQIWTELSQLR
jgi:hypothetical protein